MFAEECRKLAREYPEVKFEEAMIETISMKLDSAYYPRRMDASIV